jgi:hypothetical protein
MADEPKTETSAPRFTPDEVIARQRNRQLLIMTVIIVVLSGLVWLASRSSTEDSPIEEIMLVGGTRDDPAIVTKDVVRIQIWKGKLDKPFELTRDGEEWRVPARFNAPADRADVDSLLSRIIDSARLSRASTTTESQYIVYGLNDEDAVHVRLVSAKGAELLQFMIGRSENGSRDFVRLIGEGQPEGIFELAGLGGSFDTLYSALNLEADGQPKAARWVSTASFEPLPFLAIARGITIKDADVSLTFSRKVGSDPASEEWELTEPRRGDAEGSAVRAVIDALQNYHANDIAGRDTDAASLGVAAATREVTIRYTLDSDVIHTVHLYFGNRNEEGEVAVWLKTKDKGEFIWWAGDFVLARIFRPAFEYMRKVRLNLVPDGVTASSITVEDSGVALKLVSESAGAVTTWKIEQPWPNEAERNEVTNLLTGLSTLQGYPVSDTIDRVEMGIGPGVSTRSITAQYPEGTPPGDGTAAPLKTSVLYFGKTQQGEVPVMRLIDGVEVIYWVRQDTVGKLFQAPTAYVKLTDVAILGRGQTPGDLRVQNGNAVLHLSRTAAEGAQKQWKLIEPWDEMADQAEADALARALSGLRAIKLTEPLDKAQYKLGPGLSTRRVDMRTGEGDAVKTTQLFIGEPKDGMRSALVVKADGAEEFWLFRSNDLYPVFLAPADFRVLQPFSGKVRHILLSWKGRFDGAAPKDPERTEEQAWALANDIVKRHAAGEDFVKLQEQYNEDGDATAVYDVNPTERLVKPFLRLSSQLKVGEAGIVESAYGLHVIKRIE